MVRRWLSAGMAVVLIAFCAVTSTAYARDCDAEHVECFRACYKRNPPWPRQKHTESHYRYCQEEVCLPAYMKCVKEEKARASEAKRIMVPGFKDKDEAQSWVKRQITSVEGAVIFVAGALYLIVESMGPAAVLLAL